MTVAIRPASPKVRIRSELENCSAMNERPAVPWVSTQAGPTTSTALRNAWYLLSPAISRSRAAKVSCMESEKLITMMSGVITFRNMLRRKSSQPSAPSDEQDRDQRRRRRDDHERHAAEEDDGDQAAGGEADGVVDQPVALDRVADLELHHRHAGELGASAPVPSRSIGHRLADLADDVVQAAALRRLPARAPARSAPARRPPTGACRAGSRSIFTRSISWS